MNRSVEQQTRIGGHSLLRPRLFAGALAAVGLLAAVLLFATDVYVDQPNADGKSPTFCGSAYDVALIKRDGFMGGEVPENQPTIDRECVGTAKNYVIAGSGVGIACIVAAGFVLRTGTRRTGAGSGRQMS